MPFRKSKSYCNQGTELIRVNKVNSALRARVAELEAGIKALLRARPGGLECQDFHHALKDRHEGYDCPCKARWNTAVESVCRLLNR